MMLRKHSQAQPYFAGGSTFVDTPFVDDEVSPSSIFAAEELAADDDIIADNTASLLAKMAKLRQDMENGRESQAFQDPTDMFNGGRFATYEDPSPKRTPRKVGRRDSGGANFD